MAQGRDFPEARKRGEVALVALCPKAHSGLRPALATHRKCKFSVHKYVHNGKKGVVNGADVTCF